MLIYKKGNKQMTLNKGELVSYVAQETKLTKTDAEKAVNAVFAGITNSLQQGQDARFIGFGSFSIQKSVAREGRNPRTGDKIQIKASNRPVFKAGKELKDAVNV